MKTVYLDTREKQNIYMNPARQDLLRLLRLNGRAMTPKELADRMGISPSSATFHIKKLLSIGLVELEHTETIRGITARYYRHVEACVSVGMLLPGRDHELDDVFLRRTADQLLEGLAGVRSLAQRQGLTEQQAKGLGEMLSGVVYLTRQEAVELLELVQAFLDQKERRRPGTQAYEYMLTAYNASEVRGDVE